MALPRATPLTAGTADPGGAAEPSKAAPLRVAFVVGRAGLGGTEMQSRLLVRGLRSRGVTVDVICIEGAGSQTTTDYGDGALALTAARRRGVAGPVMLLLAAMRLRRILRLGNYDVIHAALARAYVAAPFAAPRRNRPRVVVWRRNMGTHLPRRGGVAAGLEMCAAKKSDMVIVNSVAVGRYWLRRGHVRAERLRVVPNALESWRFDTVSPVAAPAGVARVLTVGSLQAVKAHEVLIRAAAAVAASGTGIEVVILGEGPLRSQLHDLALSLGVTLITPGHVGDTRAWLASATIYAHPSHSEGSSNAIAEAMAAGCAIVATDVGGAAEMLGSTARLVPAGDTRALGAAIEHLMHDPIARNQMGDAAQGRARVMFSLDGMVETHLEIYREA